MRKIKSYFRSVLIYLLNKLGMEINVTFYTSENNIEKYFRKGQLESLPRVGDKMELLVGGNLKKFEIIEVIHRVGSQGVKIIIQ